MCPEQERSPDVVKAEMLHNRQNANSKNTLETDQLMATDATAERERGGGICKWLDSAQKHLCTLINPWKKGKKMIFLGFVLIIQLH